MRKQTKKILSLAMTAVMGLGMATIKPVDKVSARAEGHYFIGHYNADVSEYLNLRSEPNTWSPSLARIPADAKFYVQEVDGHMGKVSGYYTQNGKDVKFSETEYITGWVNLEYADENYASDGGAMDFVPDGSEKSDYWNVDWISLRSQPNTYSTCLARLYPGEKIQRTEVKNDCMGACNKRIKISFFPEVYMPMSGWINLDYTAFCAYVG
ncbi:MAG: hypothetical protein J6A58_02395 [Oscillospiraceae bacterium]|nr:hypothetical protein [Oscillospiraceae bacterium]